MEKIHIIHEDENIIVLNKPSGLVVHPFDYSTEYTLIDFLHKHSTTNLWTSDVQNNKITLQDKREINLGGIVHKLDRDTSGVMIIAKTQKIFYELKEQFKNHTIKKEYVAVVEGIIEKDKFTIGSPLGRSKKDYKQSTNPKNPRGKLRPAITGVEIISPHRQGLWGEMTLVRLFPKTGRTHQLRAHMASIGHPIVGDKAYGSKIESPRIMLHAKKISFTLNKGSSHLNLFMSSLCHSLKLRRHAVGRNITEYFSISLLASQNNKNYDFESPLPNDFNLETTK